MISNFQIIQRDLRTNKAHVNINNQVEWFNVGGPYTINSSQEVYVGDIWVMAGQSNMRGHGYRIDPFHKDLIKTKPPKDNVHLFNSSEVWTIASDPTHSLAQSPRQVHHTIPDPTVKNPKLLEYRGASLGLAFAEEYQALNQNIPVGLVASAHGGTTLEQWKRPVHLNQQTKNTTLYGAMMDRIHKIGGKIAGILWYQGESDSEMEHETTYDIRFKQWIHDVYQDLGYAVPVVFVQIGPHRITNKPDMVKGWIDIQTEQQKLFDDENHLVAGVPSIDCGLDDRLHLSATGLNKVGKRLAIAANDIIKSNEKSTPLPTRAILQHSFIKNVPPSILIEFKYLSSWKSSLLDEEIFGFQINHAVSILSTRIEPDQKSIRIYLADHVNLPLTVSYGIEQQQSFNLLTANDMTLPVFKGLKVES